MDDNIILLIFHLYSYNAAVKPRVYDVSEKQTALNTRRLDAFVVHCLCYFYLFDQIINTATPKAIIPNPGCIMKQPIMITMLATMTQHILTTSLSTKAMPLLCNFHIMYVIRRINQYNRKDTPMNIKNHIKSVNNFEGWGTGITLIILANPSSDFV